MKKNKLFLTLGLLVISAMVFSACGSKKATESQSAESTQVSVADASKETSEAATTKAAETTAAEATSVSASEESTTSPALGNGPGMNMKETENNLPENKKPDPNVAKEALVSLYLPNDGEKGIYMEIEAIPSLEPQELINKLVEYKLLKENASVLSYEADGTKASIDIAGVDLSDNRQMVCVANTLLENLYLDTITITSNGEKAASTENMSFNSNLKEVK